MPRTPLALPVSGRKFRELRELAGLDQAEVEVKTAERGHRVDRTRLSRIETGQVKPTVKQLAVLVAVFDVEVAAVLEPVA
ncbi:helix-turn-helix domain-containing protein [Amycolatopsis sp. Poz14]|uniref:helix-turn-helix domain-containing protein n=1 Tax=Amycolatopsis sp. Poz14 TaxID=1447705 RepID=UPI001EE7993A|nr:helix-turn-helix transcriptional regulator [Amycolatopsis sp. Poz14]MCG3757396.1 helix-turn-helix transcriptional regulator [Amycolatopsis sp. Poz14]